MRKHCGMTRHHSNGYAINQTEIEQTKLVEL